MERYVIAATKVSEHDPHFPVRVWVIEAESRIGALRKARFEADMDHETRHRPVRIVDGPPR